MNTKLLAWILIPVLLILGVGGYLVSRGIAIHNQIVNSDENVKSRWGYVESAYQRRADLIPNFVETVKASGKFERETLEAVTQARASATQVKLSTDDLSDPGKFQQFSQAQDMLGSSLARLLVTVEKYPDLQASAQFKDLMVTLEGTENRINTERNLYNDSVKSFNQLVRSFPTSLVAGFMDVKPREPFKAVSANAEQAPQIDFNK